MAKRKRSAYQSKYRKDKIKRLKMYFGGKCAICGYAKCLDALDFHHLNPEEKLFSLRSFRGRAYATQLAEAKKCTLICANCHRELHSKERDIIEIEILEEHGPAETIPEG